ncbi:MAG: NAD-dependent epimerase/dehydratase family protein [Desulfobacterales bacterium]|nr:NAD-dependent epimerase/dehydratase family protein [Desulfobacterales bacterium]
MRESATDPLAAFRQVNVVGTKCLARQAAEAGVRRFVFISSIKVNGEGTGERDERPTSNIERPTSNEKDEELATKLRSASYARQADPHRLTKGNFEF